MTTVNSLRWRTWRQPVQGHPNMFFSIGFDLLSVFFLENLAGKGSNVPLNIDDGAIRLRVRIDVISISMVVFLSIKVYSQ